MIKAISKITGEIIEIEKSDKSSFIGDNKWIVNPTTTQINNILKEVEANE
jgi:hypothetical protein